MTSPFSLRSAASPDTGLLPAAVDGLSLALTQGARPWSGISRVTLPYMAAMSWLCRCSLDPSGEARIGSTRSLNSAWLRRPADCGQHHRPIGAPPPALAAQSCSRGRSAVPIRKLVTASL